MTSQARVLISCSTLLDLVLAENDTVAQLFQILQQEPQPFVPYLTNRAISALQNLVMLSGVDDAALLDSLYEHCQVVQVTMPYVRAANQLNWPDLERAIDYAVAMAEGLDAVVFLDPIEVAGTQELVMTVTPEGLLKRLKLEQLFDESKRESSPPEDSLLSQLLLMLLKGCFDEVSDDILEAPPPTAIGEVIPVNNTSSELVRHGGASGGLAEPSYHQGLAVSVTILGIFHPLRIYGPSLDVVLKAKAAERDRLETDLDTQQETLDGIKQEIENFDSQFNQQVGVLYVQLFNLKALCWKEEWGFDPTLEDILKQAYEEACRYQREIYGDAYAQYDPLWGDWETFKQGIGAKKYCPPSGWEEAFKRRNDPKLKEIRRRIVKQIHPDQIYASGDPDKIRRCNELMQRVNEAYDAGDLATLERIEAELYGFFDEEVSTDLKTRLRHLLKEIELLRQHYTKLEQEIEVQKASDSYRTLKGLRAKGEALQDFLARRIQAVKAEIQETAEKLAQLRQRTASTEGDAS